MMLRPATAAGAAAVAAALLAAGQAGTATAGTVAGKIAPSSSKLPRSASQGEAQVLAMNLDTAAYGGASEVTRKGRYRLRLPAGKWALRTSIVVLGKPYVSLNSAVIATRPGTRRRLPLTLKRFRNPRKRVKRRQRPRRSPAARRANINPRDGRPYPGEAFGIERFSVVGGGADLASLGNGVPDMLTTDIVGNRMCEFTIVEWRRRDVILEELERSNSEYIDPAARVEQGHVIDPEILIRGRVEDRPGTPRRIALIAWLVDAETGARLSGDVSSVTVHTAFFANAERFAQLILRDLICARATAPAPAPAPETPGAPGPPPPPPPSPPVPTAATDVYTGTFSGEAYSEGAFIRWTWNGSARLDAAQDRGPSFPPPNGAPPGSYRTFTATTGGVDITVEADPPGDCALDGTGHVDLVPGFLNQIVVQLDVPGPAYVVSLNGLSSDTIPATRSGGAGCTGTVPVPVFTEWAKTGALAHSSPSFALAGSQAELTPATPFDYDYTTRWSFAPG